MALVSSAAARLFSSRILRSLPRALVETELLLFIFFSMRLISPSTWRLTLFWAALWEMTSPDTTMTSPVSLVSIFLILPVKELRAVAKSSRASFTCLVASARAAVMLFTVLEKRLSARAACLAMESLMLVTEVARSLSMSLRCLAILVYSLVNFLSKASAAFLRVDLTLLATAMNPAADLASAAEMAFLAAAFCVSILPVKVVIWTFIRAATSFASLVITFAYASIFLLVFVILVSASNLRARRERCMVAVASLTSWAAIPALTLI